MNNCETTDDNSVPRSKLYSQSFEDSDFPENDPSTSNRTVHKTNFQIIEEESEENNCYPLTFNQSVNISEFFKTEVQIEITERKFLRKLLIFGEVHFTILVRPFDWLVHRTPAQLQELYFSLKKSMPLLLVPPFSVTDFNAIRGTDRNLKQKVYVESFLTSLVNNPYTKSCKILEIFLNSDFYQEQLASLIQSQDRTDKLNNALLPNIDRPEKELENLIKSLPAFKQNTTIKTNNCTIHLANTAQNFVSKLSSLDGKIITATQEIKQSYEILAKKLEHLSDLFKKKEEVLSQIEGTFDLSYGPHLRSGVESFASLLTSLKLQVKEQGKIFSSSLLTEMRFKKMEVDNFLVFKSDLIKKRSQLNDRVAKDPPEHQARDHQDIQLFKAYLTSMINFSFKHLFIFQNKWFLERTGTLLEQIKSISIGLTPQIQRISEKTQSSLEHIPNNREFLDNFIQMSMSEMSH